MVRIRLVPRLLLTAALVAVLPTGSMAQTPAAKTIAKPATSGTQPAAAAQRLPVPPAETLVLLIRMSLLTLNDALQTGNYTVLRDRGSPAFREANSAAKLARIFALIETQGIDLTSVTIRAPQLTEAAVIDPGQRLHIKGFFPGQPTQLDFDLTYEPVDGHWRLFGLSAAETLAPAATAQSATPAQKPVAAKK